MEYRLTSKRQYSKTDNDGKDRNYVLFFLNDVLIFKQKIPFVNDYDKGYDRRTAIYDIYLKNNTIHQTRCLKDFYTDAVTKEKNERKVKFPVSKTKLKCFNIPKNLQIDLI